MNFVILAIVFAYVFGCLIICFFKHKKITNLKEYVIGDRRFSTLVLASTTFATYINANTTLGNIERIYSTGLLYAIPLLLTPIFWLLTFYIFAKNIHRFKGCVSITEVMENLYGTAGKYTTSIVTIVISVFVIAMQAVAIGYLSEYFMGISYSIGVFVFMMIIGGYSALGGVRLVAITDVFQFLIFFIIFPALAGMIINKGNDFFSVISNIPKSHIFFWSEKENLPKFFSSVVYVLLPAVAAPYIQRLFMAKSKAQLKKVFIVIALISLLFSIVIIILGFSIKVVFPNLSPSVSLYEAVSKTMPLYVQGLVVVAMLSVIMSTIDSWLNAASSIFTSDFVIPLFRRWDKKINELFFARNSTIIFTIISIALATAVPQIQTIFFIIINFWTPTIFPPLTLGFLGYKIKTPVFLIGVTSGIIFTLFGYYLDGGFGFVSMCTGILGNLFSMLVFTRYLHLNKLCRK